MDAILPFFLFLHGVALLSVSALPIIPLKAGYGETKSCFMGLFFFSFSCFLVLAKAFFWTSWSASTLR